MKRALDIALGGKGRVAPNPLVGALIVKNKKIISQGYHEKHGGKHAEINAIDSCSVPLNGATLYCNLEPCSSLYLGKKNPPCCDRIISSGISRVVIGQIDPNPMVSGKGVARLKEAGIDVIVGVLEKEALEINMGYNSLMEKGRPYVHLKWAQTIDGKIAANSGKSKWISSQTCRANTHYLRSKYDGILVGRTTYELDNPVLNTRYGYTPSPRPIVIDPLLKLSPKLNVFKRNPVIFCSQDTLEVDRKDRKGEYILLPGRKFQLNQILTSLKELGINSLFVEGGRELLTQFIRDEIWDRITIYIAPKILGDGISPIGDLNIETPSKAINFKHIDMDIIENHTVFNGYREELVLCLPE